MTVKEVAEALNVSERVVQLSAKRQFPEAIQNGKPTLLTEAQVTAISLELKKHHNLEGNFEVQTDLERKMLVAQAMQIIQEDLERARAELAEAKPKVEFFDQVASSKDAVPMREVAAVLNMKGWGRNNLFAFLREKSVFDSNNVPYREFQDRGYFRVVEQSYTDSYGETHVSLKTLVYQRGLDWIRKLVAGSAVKS